ncbi:recombination-associated protein RdgC [Paenalcaligenes faecalis]|uniref:recombination-associated protein RdgC n=1 Tax=Paenalcaligenes faecalis TaxID=2980099 RepID=UPI0022B97FF8|nr:recombination-associated protein RdgC [Paenalcaligenes faecalis]
MWFKNLRFFRLHPDWSMDSIDEDVAAHAFTPGNSQEPLSLGWTSVRDEADLVHRINGQILLCAKAEKKLLPSTVINQIARARAKDKEAEQGYKVGRKQMKELKEDLITELLPRAFSIERQVFVWIDPENRWLAVDAAAAATADEIMGLLAKTFELFPAVPVYTEQSPSAAMTGWLADFNAPYPFSIDQDAELRASGESRSVVRYARHHLDSDEIRKHITDGKQCTRLALTWADKISFVLTDGLEIKRLAPTDLLTNQQEQNAQDEAQDFDSAFLVMSAEFNGLITELLEALGGEKKVI